MDVKAPFIADMSAKAAAYGMLAGFAFTPYVSPGAALLLGAAFSLIFANPVPSIARRLASLLLEIAIVGLGAAMNLERVALAAVHGAWYTGLSIAAVVSLGIWLGRRLGCEPKIGLLIAAGTAVCGASAIAVIALTIGAGPHAVAIALVAVFLLNAVALLSFPAIGHALHLSEEQFGIWSALSIHDTSTVAGAAMQYGPHALEVATTVKLARAIWIIPLASVFGLVRAKKSKPQVPKESSTELAAREPRARRPWFIVAFLAVAAFFTWTPGAEAVGSAVTATARHVLVGSLFFLGSALTRQDIKTLGIAPFLQSLVLWLTMTLASLGAILGHWLP